MDALCVLCRSPDGMLASGLQGLSIAESHLAELERDTLHLYGLGALESLERSWGVQSAAAVTTVSFMFIDFDEIIPMLPRLRIKFPNILVRFFGRQRCEGRITKRVTEICL